MLRRALRVRPSAQPRALSSRARAKAKLKAAAAARAAAVNPSYASGDAVKVSEGEGDGGRVEGGGEEDALEDFPEDLPLSTHTHITQAVQALATASFDETIDIAINLNVDPRKPNQNVRAVAQLPHAFSAVRVAVFAKGAKAEEARAAGAHVVGDADLVESIQAGKIDFNRCIATPDMMGVVARVARVLGPRGLMPNPKTGTVTQDVSKAVEAAMGGQVAFRTDRNGVVHAPVGKVSFSEEQLMRNIEVLVDAVNRAKPSGARGVYYKKAFLSSTMGKGIPLAVNQAPFVAAKQKQQQGQA